MAFKNNFQYIVGAKHTIPYLVTHNLINKVKALASAYIAKNPNLNKAMIIDRAFIIIYNDSRADNICKDMINFYYKEFKENERD